jgi:hypothetical protein
MNAFVALISNGVANFAVVNGDVQNYLRPIMFSLVGLAGIVSAFFIVQGGIEYMSSSGKPERLEHAKKILRNALLGLVIVIAAGTLTAILTSAYQDGGGGTLESIPSLTPVDTVDGGGGITEVLINSIIGLFKHIIETAATPFIGALDYFTHSTPLMADNPSVFKLWLTVLGIANALFVAAVALLGFQVMSSASLGLEEIEFKQLLPKLGATFLLMNMSIFAIDAIISLSNAMISAIETAYGSLSIWDALKSVADTAGAQGFVSLLVMVVFMILSVILLVYYVMRIVTLYIGAVLSPVVALLQVVPGFKDFTMTALKVYVSNIFVLFVHVIILTLAATLFNGLRLEGADPPYDPVMAMIVGVAALITLLKTQGVMMQMSYVSVGPRALRRLGGEFMNGVGYLSSKAGSSRKLAGQEVTVGKSTGKSKPRNVTKEGYK